MTLQITPAPIRKSIHVSATLERSFKVFTGDMTRWWKPEHHIGSAPLKDVVLEPRVGGRWHEVATDGSECDWGKVLVWKYQADFATEVEVRFIAESGGTRVELEHRNLERYGEQSEQVRAALDSPDGWNGSLVAFAAIVDAA